MLSESFPDIVIYYVVHVGDTKEFSEAFHFHCLNPSLKLDCESSRLVCIQENRTSVCCNHSFVLGLMFLSLRMGFNLPNCCCSLRCSCLHFGLGSFESLMMAPKYLNCITVTIDLYWISAVCHEFQLLVLGQSFVQEAPNEIYISKTNEYIQRWNTMYVT